MYTYFSDLEYSNSSNNTYSFLTRALSDNLNSLKQADSPFTLEHGPSQHNRLVRTMFLPANR